MSKKIFRSIIVVAVVVLLVSLFITSSFLYDYFNTIVTGDMFLKPHKESYDYARGNIPRGRCLMIGDDLEKDFEVPISLGFKAILIDEDFSFRDLIGGKIDDRGSKTKVRKRFE